MQSFQNLKLNIHKKTLVIGDKKYITYGLPRGYWQDIYHLAMTVSWLQFWIAAAFIFIIINSLFASLYLLGPHSIANIFPKNFWGAFFFSVETFATVGYGDMHPQTMYGHFIATLETFFGMMNTALIAGLMFSRFSRPRARIMFVRYPIIGPVNNKNTLTIRVANARQNIIIDASAKLSLLSNEVTEEGMTIRRFKTLKLERDQSPIFLLGWNLMHVLDESSPLFGLTADDLKNTLAELILTIEGIDETTGQSILSRYNYSHACIRWNARYLELLTTDKNGISHMDYRKFHEVVSL
ncbi:MAG: ion channel [Pseudomonadota bacterium]